MISFKRLWSGLAVPDTFPKRCKALVDDMNSLVKRMQGYEKPTIFNRILDGIVEHGYTDSVHPPLFGHINVS